MRKPFRTKLPSKERALLDSYFEGRNGGYMTVWCDCSMIECQLAILPRIGVISPGLGVISPWEFDFTEGSF